MSIYDTYASAKNKIKELNEVVRQLEPQILDEVSALSAPMKTDHGTFSKVTTVKWSYSDSIAGKEKELKGEISELKAREVEDGTASSMEVIGLRFRAIKGVGKEK